MPQTYTTAELSEFTGLPRRTIQYYVTCGLLSPRLPRKGNARNAVYRGFTNVHLEELRRIQDIRADQRTMIDIRDMLHPDEDDE